MNKKTIAIIAAVALVSIAGTAGAIMVLDGQTAPTADSNDSHDHSSHDHGEPETTGEPVSEDDVPSDVKESVPGAKALKANLTEQGFENASVAISQEGEVVVRYTSAAGSGPELKGEMAEIAHSYSDVVGEHNETGGLTFVANGVKLMVSSDAAEAHADEKLNDDAFEKTFHWSTYEHHESDE